MGHLTQPLLLPKNPHMNAIVYARFSTDKQSDSSLQDQTRICRARADVLELNVVAVHRDRAVSGASCVQGRPGGRALLTDALAGRFSVLLVESLDRLSRDQVEQETIVRRLNTGEHHRRVRQLRHGVGRQPEAFAWRARHDQ